MADDTRDFIGFLGRSPNVVLHGQVSSERLADEIQDMDCFILSYARDVTESDRSNSHKILEYLSTGKVVVSSRISSYAERENLMLMAPGDDDSVLPALLKDALQRLDELNAPEHQMARRRFALDNTYEKQIDRIRDALASGISGQSSR